MFARIANSPRLLVVTALSILVATSATYAVAEQRGLLESVYWAAITATTVGYGDTFPRTTLGRADALFLVISMVLFFIPMVTASFASKLIVNRDAFTHEEQEEIKDNIARVLERLDDQYQPHQRRVDR